MEVIIRTGNKKATEKQVKSLDVKMQKRKAEQEKLNEIKTELIQKEYQENLRENLEQRLYDLIYKLNHVPAGEKLSMIQLKSLISQKSVIGLSPKYNNTELAILFEYYKQFIEKINEFQNFLPSKKNFCSFIGISSATYDNWRRSEDNERAEIMQKIDDYITDLMLTASQNGEIKEITTIFRSKSEHGLTEAVAPLVIEHKGTTNIDMIRKQIAAINQGKNIKELKENSDGVFE